ncbi:hypothetical protein SK128_011531 [Halocaridina rubra]|uniref:Uncharacterized protein n=1 Tax=Halocaridina rubra TaxID=373956 RepID=A0AAN8XJI3_HALRR
MDTILCESGITLYKFLMMLIALGTLLVNLVCIITTYLSKIARNQFFLGQRFYCHDCHAAHSRYRGDYQIYLPNSVHSNAAAYLSDVKKYKGVKLAKGWSNDISDISIGSEYFDLLRDSDEDQYRNTEDCAEED